MDDSKQKIIETRLVYSGYTKDTSTWETVIYSNGLLEQTVNVGSSFFKRKELVVNLEVWLPQEQLTLIYNVVEASQFEEMRGLYIGARNETCHDVRFIRVGSKSLEVYGAEQQMNDGNQDMGRFVDLWNTIVSVSPFKSCHVHQ